MHQKMEEYVKNPPQILEMDRSDLDHTFDESLDPRHDYIKTLKEHETEHESELFSENQSSNNMVINEQNESRAEKNKSESFDVGLLDDSFDDFIDNLSYISNETSSNQNVDSRMNLSPKSLKETTEIIMALDPCQLFDIDDQDLEIINKHLEMRHTKQLNIERAAKKDIPLFNSIQQIEELPIGSRVRLESDLYTFYGQTQKGEQFFDSIDRFHSFVTVVICQNDNHDGHSCGYQSSLEEYHSTINEPTDERIEQLRCPDCNQFTCELCLDLTIILNDCHENHLECHWTGLHSNRYFGCTTKDLYSIGNHDQPANNRPLLFVRINALLKYLWNASRILSDKNVRHVIWTLALCRSTQSESGVEYQIEDVKVYKSKKIYRI